MNTIRPQQSSNVFSTLIEGYKSTVPKTSSVKEMKTNSLSPMAGRITPLSNTQPQYYTLFQKRGEMALEAISTQLTEAQQKLALFKSINSAVADSSKLILAHGADGSETLITSETQPTAEENRKVATSFFKACKDFYGLVLFDEIYPSQERAALLEKGLPLKVGQVRSVLTNADKIVRDIEGFLKELPQKLSELPRDQSSITTSDSTRVAFAESAALVSYTKGEVAKAREAYARLGPPAQHLLTALGRSLMLPLGVGIPITATVLPSALGLPGFFAGIALIPSLASLGVNAADIASNRFSAEQIVSRFPEAAHADFLASLYCGIPTGLAVSAPVIMTITHGAPLITLGLPAALGVLASSMVICPILGVAYFSMMSGSALMAIHAPYFSVEEALKKHSESQQAQQHVLTTTERATAARSRVEELAAPLVEQDVSFDVYDHLRPALAVTTTSFTFKTQKPARVVGGRYYP